MSSYFGLKYLNKITANSLSGTQQSFNICSINNFVVPYGFVVERGKSSVIGTVFGSPYTVADDENTIFLQFIFIHYF